MIHFHDKKTIMLNSRAYGKSVWNQIVQSLIQPDIQTLDTAKVDEKTWYTVKLTMPVQQWIRQQPIKEWYDHKNNTGCFDVSEKLYTALNLKWK